MKKINYRGQESGVLILKKLFISFTAAFCLMTGTAWATGEQVADYTAYPPFLPRVTSPNILFMLDYSKSMVRPSYGTCSNVTGLSDCRYTFSNLTDDYDNATTYSGYFDSTAKYTWSSPQFQKDSGGTWNGNWLNWLTMTQYDVLKKVVVGGDITPAPENANPTNMKLQSVLPSSISGNTLTFRKTMDIGTSADITDCTGKVPGTLCTMWPTVSYNWGATPGTATQIFGSTDTDDEVSAAQALPFQFSFYGNTYNQIYISTNGLIGFDSSLTGGNTLFYDDMEVGSGSWSSTGLWHRAVSGSDSCARAYGGSASWYYGQYTGGTCNYSTGVTNSGTLTSGSISLPAGKTANLSFWYFYETESTGTFYDQRWIQISTDGGATYTNLLQLSGDVMNTWLQTTINLTAYAGNNIKLRFYFNTVDSVLNGYKGWYIDNVAVYTSPSLPSTNTPPHYNNVDMPNGASPSNILAPFWDDLLISTASSSTVKTFTEGTAPNRVYHVRYENMIHFYDVGRADPLTFEILLYEGSNHIKFQYNNVRTPNALFGAGRSATVGVENNDGTKAKKYSYNGSTFLSNSQAIFATPHISYTISPGAGGAGKTLFNPAVPLDTSNNYNVYVALSELSCGSAGSYLNNNNSQGKCYDHQTSGLLQDFRDGELGGTLGFRLGIMQLNNTDGGNVVKHFNQKDTTGWASLMTATRGQAPTTNTPLAEALYEAEGYFKEDTGFRFATNDWSSSGAGTCPATGTNYDPYCFQSAAQLVPCCKSFVLLVSSGNYSHDDTQNIYGDAANAETWTNTWDNGCRSTLGNGTCSSAIEGTKANGGWLDDISYKAHTTDWRSALDGTQNLTVYAINTFGAGSGDGASILRRAAMYGGFEDVDSDNVYDADKYNLVSGQCTAVTSGGAYGEDDRNCDGKPDTYFEASGGGDLKAKVIDAVTDILKSSASGTTVSVLSTSASGEGAIYQAYFYPAKIENVTDERTWPGYMRGFFLDKFQNLRDDYSGGAAPDAKLVMKNSDRIARMSLNTTTNAVDVNLFTDTDGDGTSDGSAGTTNMDNVVTIWEAGKKLALKDKSTRSIYTWADLNGDGAVLSTDSAFDNSGETRLFTTDNKDTLKPYLCAGNATCVASSDEAGNIINFIRGNAVTGYRNRCITISGAATEAGCAGSNQRVWALGDIVYSTPTLVSGPGEKFDDIYGDSTYRTFRTRYANRRSVIYAGGNDGVLHAFNGGVYKIGDDPDTGSVIESGRFIANSSSSVNGFDNGWSSSIELGDELWAFVAHDNLPHLAWLGCNGTATDPSVCSDAEYTHVYYVDQRPKVTDVRIFDDDTDHPGGWGTILIMGMRLGGGAIDVDINGDAVITGTEKFRSAFYAFDITNPENPPKLLWRFNDSGLGFTTSYPAIARICSNGTNPCTGTEKWYMVVGSGPKNETGTNNRDYGGSSTTQEGKVFVVELKDYDEDGTLLEKTFTVDNNTFMGDPTVVDADINFTSDVIYIGSAISTTSGKVYRINTNGTIPSTTGTNWTPSTLFDPDTTQTSANPDDGKDMGPLLVGPSVSKDSQGNIWVFFGTGRLRSTTDLSNSQQQGFYAIKDGCWKGTGESTCTGTSGASGYTYEIGDLLNTGNLTVCTSAAGGKIIDPTAGQTCESASPAYSSYNSLVTDVRNYKGWYINLGNTANPSERVLSRSVVLGGLVIFTSYTPTSEMCSIFGDSNVYSLYYETGTAYIKPTIGTTGSGATETVNKSMSLGKGMPTAVGVAIGETVSGFVQKSTGEIVRIETQPGLSVRSGAASWREKTGGGGTSEIETIYKHIVK